MNKLKTLFRMIINSKIWLSLLSSYRIEPTGIGSMALIFSDSRKPSPSNSPVRLFKGFYI